MYYEPDPGFNIPDYRSASAISPTLNYSYSTPRAFTLYPPIDYRIENEEWSHLDSHHLSSSDHEDLYSYSDNSIQQPLESHYPGLSPVENGLHFYYSPNADSPHYESFTPKQEPLPQYVNMSEVTSSPTPPIIFSRAPSPQYQVVTTAPRKRGRPLKNRKQDEDEDDEQQSDNQTRKRPRVETTKAASGSKRNSGKISDGEDDDDEASDVYDPSSTSPSDSDSSYVSDTPRVVRRTRSRKHISAAHALRTLEAALVPKIQAPDYLLPSQNTSSVNISGNLLDLIPMPVDHQNSSHSPYPTGSDHSSPASMVQYGERESSYDRNRSPQTFSPGRRPSIPQPVPIPNLTKKSRGRKVPVAPQADAAAVMGSEGTNAYGGRRAKQDMVPERRYLCTVEGCGKCFVRGEHLKRHIRSLHTNETPHLCPQIGCGKTFSRRDNLAQHAKVHL